MSRFLVTTESSSRSLASDSESSSDISNRPELTVTGEGALICALALQKASNMIVARARERYRRIFFTSCGVSSNSCCRASRLVAIVLFYYPRQRQVPYAGRHVLRRAFVLQPAPRMFGSVTVATKPMAGDVQYDDDQHKQANHGVENLDP